MRSALSLLSTSLATLALTSHPPTTLKVNGRSYPLTGRDVLSAPAGINLVRDYAPWTDDVVFLAGDPEPTAPRVASPFFGGPMRASPPLPLMIREDVVFDATNGGAPRSWISIDVATPWSAKRATCSFAASSLATESEPDSRWSFHGATGYFALPLGTPQEASPHGPVGLFHYTITRATNGASERVIEIWFAAGSIDSAYVNATYALRQADPKKPKATMRVDFVRNHQAEAENISWTVDNCILTEPVRRVSAGVARFDAVRARCTSVAIRTPSGMGGSFRTGD